MAQVGRVGANAEWRKLSDAFDSSVEASVRWYCSYCGASWTRNHHFKAMRHAEELCQNTPQIRPCTTKYGPSPRGIAGVYTTADELSNPVAKRRSSLGVAVKYKGVVKKGVGWIAAITQPACRVGVWPSQEQAAVAVDLGFDIKNEKLACTEEAGRYYYDVESIHTTFNLSGALGMTEACPIIGGQQSTRYLWRHCPVAGCAWQSAGPSPQKTFLTHFRTDHADVSDRGPICRPARNFDRHLLLETTKIVQEKFFDNVPFDNRTKKFIQTAEQKSSNYSAAVTRQHQECPNYSGYDNAKLIPELEKVWREPGTVHTYKLDLFGRMSARITVERLTGMSIAGCGRGSHPGLGHPHGLGRTAAEEYVRQLPNIAYCGKSARTSGNSALGKACPWIVEPHVNLKSLLHGTRSKAQGLKMLCDKLNEAATLRGTDYHLDFKLYVAEVDAQSLGATETHVISVAQSTGHCGCNDKGGLHIDFDTTTSRSTGSGDTSTGSIYWWGVPDILWPAVPVPEAFLALTAAQQLILPPELQPIA